MDSLLPRVSLTGLQAAVRVASHGSFLRAAVSMGVSQSQLSRRVSTLEAYLGRKLFHRHGRGVVLTDFGHRILPRAQLLMAEMEAFDALVSDAREQVAGDVALGVVPLASRRITSSLVRRVQSSHPGIRLRILEAYSGQIEEWLASGRVDIGVFNRYGSVRPANADPLMHGEVSIIGASEHPLFRQKEVSFDSLRHVPVVMPARPNSLTEHILDVAASRGTSLHVALEAGSATLIQEAMVASGLVTLSPPGTYAHAISRNQLASRRLHTPVIKQTTWIATTTQRPLSAASRAVEVLVRELLYTPA